ncbi:serine/threonine-protein kinase [Actinomadura fibrosa]|uniref:Serine/threonine-protein kinase n=1 Tax=Actinomadura fibrosa TaxID=111802 RepID=A0ABW2XMU1_9ACTN|nr:serine/threonine-protein kinase [Actinomadura fibrosa]
MQEQTRRTELPSGAEALRPGDPSAIGEYELVGRLGEGGMGAVYLGRDGAGRYVAIKVIRAELAADEGFRARFRDEVGHARRVASFCTAKVLDSGAEDGRPYLVTEYVDGTPLDAYIEARGALPDGTLNGVAVGVAAALTAIHAAGLVHRDLKPPNVLLSVSGPRVIDFGIARVAGAASGHTQAGFVVGTPGWMAPEQVLRGEVSTAADVFAWGCLVAFAGTGRHPHGTGTVLTMAARAENGEHDLDGLGEPLRGLVERALNPDPERRPDAQELLLELVGGAAPAEASPTAAQAAVDAELTRSWQAEALPPPWVPPSPPQGTRSGTRMYETPPPGPGPNTPPPGPGPSTPPPRQGPSTPPPWQGPTTPPPRPTTLPPELRPATPPPGPRPWVGPPMAPGPAAPTRRRGRGCLGCLIAAVVVIALAVVAGITAYRYFKPVQGEVNKPIKDGQFTFVVSPVSCGGSVRGMTIYTGGKFCRVRFTVTNAGPKTRTLSEEHQKIFVGDTSYTPRTMVKGTTADSRNSQASEVLSPGERFTGMLVFEVPAASQPTSVLLHERTLSKGVRIPAR